MTDTLQLKQGDPCSPVATELAEELLIKDGAGKILAKGTITSEGTTSLLPQGTDKFETAVYCTVSFAAKGVPNSRIYILSIGGSDTDPLTYEEATAPLEFTFGNTTNG